ncbi:MAG: hypothetical protein GY711_18005 [bacterium]|nr:hypothetical protein [bacterium]
MPPLKKKFRRKKLIKPALQLKIVFAFVLTAGVAATVQALMLWRATIETLATSQTTERAQVSITGIVVDNLLLTCLVLIPFFLFVGIIVTSRIAGPVYRFEQYLRQVTEGTATGPCKIREDDELQELCDWINLALESVRGQSEGAAVTDKTDAA